MRAVAVLGLIASCGGTPAPELAPLPDTPSATADAGPPPPEEELAELVEALAGALAKVDGDCSEAERVLISFGRQRGARAKALAAQIEERGTEQTVMSRVAASIESIQKVALSCPGIQMGDLFEREDDHSFGESLASAASSGVTVHWRVGEGCHTWKLAGGTSGELIRLSPAPVLRFGYAIEGNDVVVSGIESDAGPLSELGAEASCSTRLGLAAPDADGFAIGDGRWHRSATDCATAHARAAPSSCLSSVSQRVAEAPASGDRLRAATDGGWISVVTRIDGTLACEAWQFVGKGRRKKLQHRADDGSITRFDATYDGKTLRLNDEAYPVTAISDSVYRVKDHPWFIGRDCGGLKMAGD